MTTAKASTRVYILLYLLMYSDEPFLRRWWVHDGAELGCYVQFSALDLATRLNCGVARLREQLDKAAVLGVLEPVRMDGNSYQFRVIPVRDHSPATEELEMWRRRWRSRSTNANSPRRPRITHQTRRPLSGRSPAGRKKIVVPTPPGDGGEPE